MQIINVKVSSAKLFLQNIDRSTSILADTKIIHCYLADDLFKISYAGGIIAYDLSKCKGADEMVSFIGKAMELIRSKLTNTKVLESLK